MTKQKLYCGFCGKQCTPNQDVGFITFPNNEQKPIHLTHSGVREEYNYQMKEQNEEK